jgi:hypothetical protein
VPDPPPDDDPFAPDPSAELDPEPEPLEDAAPLTAILDLPATIEVTIGAVAVEAAIEPSTARPPLPAWGDLALVDPGVRQTGDTDPRLLTIRLTSTGDAQRDARRLRRVHGLLLSYPGVDRFVFHVFEASRQYHLEFPNSTTGFCKDLFTQLTLLLGEGMVAVERLRLQ